MRKIILFAVATILTTAPALAASSQKSKDMIAVYNSLDEGCRGGHGDDPATDRACDARNIISKSLRKDGYCYQLETGWNKCR